MYMSKLGRPGWSGDVIGCGLWAQLCVSAHLFMQWAWSLLWPCDKLCGWVGRDMQPHLKPYLITPPDWLGLLDFCRVHWKTWEGQGMRLQPNSWFVSASLFTTVTLYLEINKDCQIRCSLPGLLSGIPLAYYTCYHQIISSYIFTPWPAQLRDTSQRNKPQCKVHNTTCIYQPASAAL